MSKEMKPTQKFPSEYFLSPISAPEPKGSQAPAISIPRMLWYRVSENIHCFVFGLLAITILGWTLATQYLVLMLHQAQKPMVSYLLPRKSAFSVETGKLLTVFTISPFLFEKSTNVRLICLQRKVKEGPSGQETKLL